MITVTPLPTPPNTGNPATFDTLADAFIDALPTMVTEVNALAIELEAKETIAIDKAEEASAALNSTIQVYTNTVAVYDNTAATANVTKWLAATAYTQSNVVWSPITYYTYRRKIAGTTATDPSSDTTNWALISTPLPSQVGNNNKILATNGTLASWVYPSVPPSVALSIL